MRRIQIQWMNMVVGVGAGVVDEVAEWQDGRVGRTTPFRTWTDWSRIGLAAIGYLGQAFDYFPAICGPLATSETTLLTKTIGLAIRSRSGISVTRTSGATPATPAAAQPGSGKQVGWRPLPVGV